MWRRYLEMTILLLVVGCLLLVGGLHFRDTAMASAPTSGHGYGKEFKAPEPVPTSQGTLTPTDTFMPTGSPMLTDTSNPCDPVWSVVSSPNIGTDRNDLRAVAVVSANDVWAVGGYYNASTTQTLVEHWNGTSWSVVSSPNVGTSHNILYGVTAVSANDVWAVGDYFNAGGIRQTLTERWDGTSWSVVSSPNVGTNHNILYGVMAVLSNDVWAVGNYYNGNGGYRTLIQHWNGTSWSVVSSPNPGSSSNSLNGVAVVSANDVWAVGDYQDQSSSSPWQTLVERWNGTSWSVVPSPNPGLSINSLSGVAVVSANDIWAVGRFSNGGIALPLAEHWNGTVWSVSSIPLIGTDEQYLNGVAAVSANDVWAVGYYCLVSCYLTLIEHYNGTSWSAVDPFSSTNHLFGVAAVSANDVWAVGYYVNSSNITQTVVEHYTSPCATPPPTPAPSNTPANTPTLTPTPAAISFSDVNPSDYFYDGVRYLSSHGVISGYSDGTFKPYNEATRAQVTKIIVLALGWQPVCPSVAHFSDVPVSDVFFCFVETAYAHGIINGYDDNTFRPGTNITRAQLCKVAVLAMGWPTDTSGGPHFTDVPQSSVFYGPIETAVHHGIISGYNDGTFKPNDNTMRGQICKIVYGAIRNP